MIQRRERSYVFGHRGSPRERPENTLVSFEHAVEQGADGVELDVRFTIDESVVVCHDSDLERTCGSAALVSDTTRDALGDIDAGWSFAHDDGTHPFRGTGVRVPTLPDVLASARKLDYMVNVEVKVDADQGAAAAGRRLAVAAAGLVAGSGLSEQVLFSSFDADALGAIVESHPEITTALLTAPGVKLNDILPSIIAAGFDGWNPAVWGLENEEIQRARESQAPSGDPLWVGVWTVDEEADMRRVIECGADALITNVPGVAARVVSEPR